MAEAQGVSMDSDASEIMESEVEEAVDESAHEKLLNSLFSLDGKKRNKNAIRGLPNASENLDLVVHARKESSKISLEDLKVKGKHVKAELKKPMSNLETEKAKRQIARELLGKDMSKWDPVVQEIRSAPQTIFSKRPHGLQMYEAVQPKPFTPRTPLEMELFEALGKSQDILKPDQELTEAEAKALKAMSVKEARARRAELMKHHELLSRMELKAKRQKKIKSKRYRKILRKEKLVAEKKELEQLQKTDPEAFFEKIEQMDRARMEERLTLKHRGGSKFARAHKVYSKFDDKTREAMQDMIQKSQELTKKREDNSSSEDEEDVDQVRKGNKEGADDEEINDTTKEVTDSARQLEQLKTLNKKAGGWLDSPKTIFAYTQQQEADKTKTGTEELDAGADRVLSCHAEIPASISKDPAIDVIQQQEAESHISSKRPPRESANSADNNESVSDKRSKKRRRDDDVLDSGSPEKNPSKRKKVTNSSTPEIKGSDLMEPAETSGLDQVTVDLQDSDDSDAEHESIAITSDLKDRENSTNKAQESTEKKKKKRSRKKKKDKEDSKASASEVDQKKVKEITLQPPMENPNDQDDADIGENGSDEDDGKMKVTMEELFQDEDVVEEFNKEKAEAEERSRPKFEDTKLPGWGNWAGPDYKARDKKRSGEQRKRAEAKARKLQNQQQKIKQPHVWLNPNRDESVRKLQPKNVPFPYTSVQQYEASLRQPVSRGFVRETAFKLLTKPEVVTKLGHIIKPIDKEDYFKDREDTGEDGILGNSKNTVDNDMRKGKVKQKRRSIR